MPCQLTFTTVSKYMKCTIISIPLTWIWLYKSDIDFFSLVYSKVQRTMPDIWLFGIFKLLKIYQIFSMHLSFADDVNVTFFI